SANTAQPGNRSAQSATGPVRWAGRQRLTAHRKRRPPRAQVRCTCGRESRSWWPPELVRMLCIGRIGLQVGSSGLTKTLPGRLRPSPEAAKTTGRSDVIDSSSTHHTAPGFDPGIVAAIHCLSCTVLVTKTWMVGKNRQRRRKNDSKINGTRRYD